MHDSSVGRLDLRVSGVSAVPCRTGPSTVRGVITTCGCGSLCRIAIAGRMIDLGWLPAGRGRCQIRVVSNSTGRWDLLVVPHECEFGEFDMPKSPPGPYRQRAYPDWAGGSGRGMNAAITVAVILALALLAVGVWIDCRRNSTTTSRVSSSAAVSTKRSLRS